MVSFPTMIVYRCVIYMHSISLTGCCDSGKQAPQAMHERGVPRKGDPSVSKMLNGPGCVLQATACSLASLLDKGL